MPEPAQDPPPNTQAAIPFDSSFLPRTNENASLSHLPSVFISRLPAPRDFAFDANKYVDDDDTVQLTQEKVFFLLDLPQLLLSFCPVLLMLM